jgi:tetratricopeptide (TPR) repeat protein
MALIMLKPTMMFAYAENGDYANARLLAGELGRITQTEQLATLALIDALENPALKDHAVEVIQQSRELDEGVSGRAYYLAMLGEYELAIDNLDKAFTAGDPYAIYMNVGSTFEQLRDNPRFQALLVRMNLWP